MSTLSLKEFSTRSWHLQCGELNLGVIGEHSKDSPDVISCPPLVFLGALIAGMLLNWFIPLRSFSSECFRLTGGLLGLAGTLAGIWGVYTLRRAGTSVRPGQPVTALVTDGPYRFSRNPLYVALTVIYLGIVLSSGLVWLLVTLIPVLTLVHWRIVRREEVYLEARFGDVYRAYRVRVRRWI
jgi:protein-S-isoprenylcysteine O-methyltransferase Ste14